MQGYRQIKVGDRCIWMRESDGYLNGSKAVRELGKDYFDWKRNKRTVQYLAL